MTRVALETSARAASLAVRHGSRTRVARLESGRAHASDLFPALERLLAELGAAPRGIEAVFVGTGPGSYTGLRVGIATALGLARGSGAVLRGVPSGETLALGELEPGAQGTLLLDARSGELYFARYRRVAEDVEVLTPPCVLRPVELAGRLPADGPIFGDASVAEAAGLDAAARARLVVDRVPDAAQLLVLGERRLERLGPQAPEELEPLYLRPFAAQTRRR